MAAQRPRARARGKKKAPAQPARRSAAANETARRVDPGAAPEVERFLAALPDEQRAALEKLRRSIRAAVPRAEECMSYGIPAFRLDGKVLVCYAASANHCAFYPGSGTAVAAHAAELAAYSTSKGTIRFQPGKPLPAALLRKLLAYRVAENVAKSARATKTTTRRG